MSVDPRGSLVVIGLGRFGSSLARSLADRDVRLLAIDADMKVVQEHADTLRDVVCADATDATALSQLGIDAGWRAVVAIGSIQQSLLAATQLQQLGVEDIWAKALTAQHATLLRRVGATHVVQPEADAGRQIAELLVGHMTDYVAVNDDFAVATTAVPHEQAGHPLSAFARRPRDGVRCIAVQRADGRTEDAQPDTVPLLGDHLLLCGRAADLERFARTI